MACQDINRRKHRCQLSFDIGSSDCKTHRLVSLTRDFSVFNDLSGGRDLVNVLANGYYMHFALFVKGCNTTHLKFTFSFMHIGHFVTSTFALFVCRTYQRTVLYALHSVCQGFLKNSTLTNRILVLMHDGHRVTFHSLGSF